MPLRGFLGDEAPGQAMDRGGYLAHGIAVSIQMRLGNGMGHPMNGFRVTLWSTEPLGAAASTCLAISMLRERSTKACLP